MATKDKQKKLRWLKKRQLKKNHQWRHDFDYLAKLSDEELEFMNKFIKEYYDAAVKKGDTEALHSSDEMRKDCYNRNNRGNRDLFSIYNSNGNINRYYEITDQVAEELDEEED